MVAIGNEELTAKLGSATAIGDLGREDDLL
jgi:hypothetical protein